jgi:hypothetical protein
VDEPKTHPLPQPRVFSAPFYAPKSSPPTYLPHFISRSFHLKNLVELVNFNPTKLCGTRLKKREELNIVGT